MGTVCLVPILNLEAVGQQEAEDRRREEEGPRRIRKGPEGHSHKMEVRQKVRYLNRE